MGMSSKIAAPYKTLFNFRNIEIFETSSPIVRELVFSLTRLSFPLVRFRHVRESGIRNPANFCSRNPESTMVWNPESTLVWNPESRRLESGKGLDLDSGCWDPESRTFLDSLTWGESCATVGKHYTFIGNSYSNIRHNKGCNTTFCF